MEPTVVINATSIGRTLGGIGVYGANLIKTLARADDSLRYTVLLSRSARSHFTDTVFPPHMTVRWVGGAVSPDRGSLGHLLRWLYANQLALHSGGALVFGTSQIEAALVGLRKVVMVHDLIPLLFPAHHPRQRYFYRHLLGPALRAAAAVVVPSCTTKALLESHYHLHEEKVRVIPHGVPVPTRPRSASAGAEPLVLCLGRAGPMKNVQTLVRAHRLLPPGIRARLVLVGAEAPRQRGAEGGAVFRGAVSEAEKLDLLDRASLLVCPSLYEGFGFPPLEAMARGCPVIASGVGSLPEVCGDAARYVDPLDPAGMAAAIENVLLDERVREGLIERGLRRVQAFSWEASAREHVKLFEEVLARPAHAPMLALGR
jgi:glycosyltransferase involved in cell wall biosynthesis